MARSLLGALTAIGLASSASAALAESQISLAPQTAQTTVSGVAAAAALDVSTQAVSNTISVILIGDYAGEDNQALGLAEGGAVAATSNLDAVTATGPAQVTSHAGGAMIQVDAGEGAVLLRGGLGPHLQATASGSIAAATAIRNSSFAALTATSSSVGAGVIAESSGGGVRLGDAADPTDGLARQTNATNGTAGLTLANSAASGAVNGLAQAVGNSVAAGETGTGVLGPGFSIEQANSGNHSATATLTDVTLAASGNTFAADAAGNVARFGAATSGVLRQLDSSDTVAATTLRNATVNGEFSARAVGNAASFASTTAETLVSQNVTHAQTATVVGQKLVLNGDATFTATALGNQFAGTQTPGVIPGEAFHQRASGAGPTASVSLSDISGSGDIAIAATAIGNVATLSNPLGFFQDGNTPATGATVTLSGITNSGGLSIQTATLANSVVIH